MLSEYKDQILGLAEDNVFDDPEVVHAIDWSLYRGRSIAEQTFTIPDAALMNWEVGSEELEDGVSVQRGRRDYLIKESSLPAGVTVKDLTKNDHVTVDGSEFIVDLLDKTLEFVIYAKLVGAK